ncbi:MAG TPA: sensor histidine kinase, partial [Clostridiaceae bacterium]|nr:sensor histidine kinase [Clostridiaceae bacterium]
EVRYAAREKTNLYEEISSVCGLADGVLESFIEVTNQEIADWNEHFQKALIFLFATVIFLVLLLIVLTRALFLRMAQDLRDPILRLSDFSKQLAQGSLQTRVEEPDLAELIPLSRDLNVMAIQLERLFEEKLFAESQLRTAEIMLMQMQIKPHFIYNTLASIVWLAEQNRNQDVVNMTMSFTTFLRLSLSGGHETVTVEQELNHIRSYFEVQAFRYGSKMTYDIVADPSVYQCLILRFTLQPLVENAIYHGIKGRRRGKGHIQITGVKVADDILFKVTDTGPGFSAAALAEFADNMAAIKQGSYRSKLSVDRVKSGGFGLRNVASRLWIYYKTELHIANGPDGGATVSFLLPPQT